MGTQRLKHQYGKKITNGQSLVKLSQYLLFVVKFYTLCGKFVLLVGPKVSMIIIQVGL